MLRRLFKARRGLKDPDPGAEPVPGSDSAADSGPAPDSETDTVTALLALPREEAEALIRALEDADELVTLALAAGRELRETVLAHPLLARPEALGVLEKRSRHRDKSLNRHARSRLEHIRTLHHDAAAASERARELAQSLARPAPPVSDRAWRERQHQLHQRLEQTLDTYAGYRGELAALGEAVPDLEALRPDPNDLPALDAPAPGDDGAAADASAPPPFDALVAAFEELDAALAAGAGAGEPFERLAARRRELTDRWLTAADQQAPSDRQHRVFESVSHRFHEIAEAMARLDAIAADAPAPLDVAAAEGDGPSPAFWQHLATRRAHLERLARDLAGVRWPEWAEPPQRLHDLVRCQERLEAEVAAADRLLEARRAELESLVERLAATVDDGGLAAGQSLLTQARSIHESLPAGAARELGKRLSREAARLAELRDWQTFATSPKRESLVSAMTALAESPLPPREQADRIKALRREWQALGPVTHAADGELAKRFNDLAEQAFEPCRSHFAAQAAERKANLEQRTRICDQLEAYLDETDWQRADMKAAERIMRTAREEWRVYHPVDRGPGKAVERRFEALQARLHEAVKAEWERNLHAKEAIVEEARALADASDLSVDDRIAAAKALQQRWQAVGITPRRPDQRLWRSFRAACDTIFSAREQARDAAERAARERERQCREQLEAFAAALAAREPATASTAELRELQRGMTALEHLPRGVRRELEARRDELV
ncbi:MAG: DUF349 domain-containing protein, partial [Pseudomonadota bacterium]